ncbi:penicillin-binding protein 1A [Marivirga tractuosa]|uniref:Peptidoglycan glycosyltransferase n=1 Tax=Marivirga tractuosa (strain ATCC 23168 / DSM 4126 / NBRC 15989 / NCIMB 1408 / VKM B-1430 / H-43) TaxID=643867 RepID=E4TNX5_MARTH|nr:transglycosylase domain-containing protein [Marivirga tractuosa]ADR22539.1 Peptidoglycan glycosyltransferase [Marivirga tractuosa DSM 4126]BDD16790.1 penicillin-binding protein 1A [Marivirga tractuosa]
MKNSTKYKKLIIALWSIFFLAILGFSIFIYSISINFNGWYGELPGLKSLENPKSDLSSILYFADNKEMGKYYRYNRSQVTFDELSPNVVNALIATEDIRYSKHSGIDLYGLGRVFFKSILMFDKSAGGGSTISQQLAKILFRTRSDLSNGSLNDVPVLGLIIAKMKEWIVAVKLERSYTKKEIIAMYLNTFEFGSNAFGIKTASQTFFNTTPDQLTVPEAAVLVGLCKNPNLYSPVYQPENAFQRRNVVLNQMRKYGYLEDVAYDSISSKPIELDYDVENHNDGLATYFRGVILWDLLAWSKQNGYDLYEDGLRIYTTIDSRMQKYAEEAVEEHMKFQQELFDEHWEGKEPWRDESGRVLKDFVKNEARRTKAYSYWQNQYGDDEDKIFEKLNEPKPMKVFSWEGEIDTTLSTMDSIRYFKQFLHAGFMAMNPNNGHIKAWVGGINHKYFKYDHVKQGRRQPGSTFKPLVYAAAIDNGYSPCYEIQDVPVTFEVPGDPPTWTPSNSGGKFSGETMTLRQAMARSLNSGTAYVMQKIGPQTVVDYARRLGIESPLAAVPSLCLGTSDVSIYELIGAYSTFVNEGFYTEPFYIERIEDKNGKVLKQFVPKTGEALSSETAYAMLHMLKGSTEISGGTALGLDRELRENNEIGAKTGTTQNYSDGWFVGVTKDLAAGVWVGGDERSIHFRNIGLGQGARMAMPIWEKFMKKVYEDESLPVSKGEFNKPSNFSIELDCDNYKMQQNNMTDSTEQIQKFNVDGIQ